LSIGALRTRVRHVGALPFVTFVRLISFAAVGVLVAAFTGFEFPLPVVALGALQVQVVAVVAVRLPITLPAP